jgi:hypothetical protein
VKLASIIASAWALSAAYAQDSTAKVSARVELRRSAATVTITANGPRPLELAVSRLSDEYGWIVDYEDPPYGPSDVVDATTPQLRAQNPKGKRVTMVKSAEFQSHFREDRNESDPIASEARVLETVVSDYERNMRIGRFSVRAEGTRRFSVVGTGVLNDAGASNLTRPLLDTPVSVPLETQTAARALDTILAALTTQSRTRVSAGMVPVNLLTQTSVTVGGEHVAVRTLLRQVLSSIGHPLRWELLYDPDERAYFFNVLPVRTAAKAG